MDYLKDNRYLLYIYICGEVITTSLFSLTRIMASKGDHPQEEALFQVSEL